ncbi:hypothetical protein [Flavobacterium wongokense]|uniref:hypothetical protein n=1 Tax=Flavobacterium wongokense TaxID=2910674 RepID=UPI001F1F17D6|nr:hypothetical protein [Flavobacterium sp. WG47]MCF6132346.1 hypothetical protein [Flavobacterium sp. WG47]
MELRSLSFFIIFLFFISCSTIVSVTENVNSKYKFDSKEVYLERISKHKHFSKDKLVILNDNDLNLLLYEIVNNHLSTYYGIANTNYFVSADQLKIKSCSGQIITLYKMFVTQSNDLNKSEVSESGILEKFNIDHSKNTLIFLYSYKLGNLAKSKISAVITKLQNENDFDYRIICLDNNDINNKQ